jgi:hypothetical protein
MFSVVRIIMLIACAYAGSAIAEMQVAQPPDPASVPQP